MYSKKTLYENIIMTQQYLKTFEFSAVFKWSEDITHFSGMKWVKKKDSKYNKRPTCIF